MKIFHTILLASLIVMGASASVQAASKVAVISQEIAIAKSKIGTNIAQQVIAIEKQIDSELEPEMLPLRSQAQQLSAEVSALSPEVLRTRNDLLRREQDLRQKIGALINWKQRQLEATGAQAEGPLLQAYESAVNAIIAEKEIDILLNGSTVLYRNAASDITEAVVQKMDLEVTTSVVTRVRVPRQAPPQQRPTR